MPFVLGDTGNATVIMGSYVISGGVASRAFVETSTYRVAVTYFSVGSDLFRNRLVVDSNVLVNSVNGSAGNVVLAYRLVDANGSVLDSGNRTVGVMTGSSSTINQTLAVPYFWSAISNDNMTFTLTTTWEANQTGHRMIVSSFVPCPLVTGVYPYYFGFGICLCAFGFALFYNPRKRKKT